MTKKLLAAFVPMLLLAGCNGAFWGNLIVLAMTFGIFLGTLSLGRTSTEATRSGAPQPPTSSRS